jgi:hypothetical protein
MNGLNTHSVVEQMTHQLATRRRAMAGRRAAYLALARAILSSDECQERLLPAAAQGAQRWDWDSAAA